MVELFKKEIESYPWLPCPGYRYQKSNNKDLNEQISLRLFHWCEPLFA